MSDFTSRKKIVKFEALPTQTDYNAFRLIFESFSDAIDAIVAIGVHIGLRGFAPVSLLYSQNGIISRPVDERHGWYSVRGAEIVKRAEKEWVVTMPLSVSAPDDTNSLRNPYFKPEKNNFIEPGSIVKGGLEISDRGVTVTQVPKIDSKHNPVFDADMDLATRWLDMYQTGTWKEQLNYIPNKEHGPNIPEKPPTHSDSKPIWDLVIEDMKARDEMGRLKYGGPLQAFDGRSTLWDAYQEALDLAVYLRKRITEEESKKSNSEGSNETG